MRWRRGRRRDVKVWYLQKGGGWLSGGQCNQDELDINCRKHSSPVNTAGVRAIFLTLCSYNINIRNILILTHSIRSGLLSLSDWISVLKFQPIDKSWREVRISGEPGVDCWKVASSHYMHIVSRLTAALWPGQVRMNYHATWEERRGEERRKEERREESVKDQSQSLFVSPICQLELGWAWSLNQNIAVYAVESEA